MSSTNCQTIVEAWGPNEGCAEFMTEPDTFPCGDPAAVQYILNDLSGGPQYDLKVCKLHVAETEARVTPEEFVSKWQIA